MFLKKKHIPILTYHNICNDPNYLADSHDWITSAEFHSQLEYLKNSNFTPISFSDLLDSNKNLPKKPIILSFDDGYESCYSIIYPLLKEYNFKASFFIFTDFISGNHTQRKNNDWNIGYRPTTGHLIWPEIHEMIASGLVEIGSHTKTHRSLTEIDLEEVENELKESKKVIEDHLKKKIDVFSYPGGHGYDKLSIKNLVKDSGYLVAASAFPSAIENIKKMDTLALKRVEINQSVTTNTRGKALAKNKFITKVYPRLFFISKFNSLNWLANFLIRLASL
ncbi:MAG: polysaccharide deacetylase family protein [Vicingaceae bacterium]